MPFQVDLITELDNLFDSFSEKKNFFKKFLNKKIQKSIYIHGSPGGGKTFLVDLFFKLIIKKKLNEEVLRIHFQEFINIVHMQINQMRIKKKKNPIERVSDEIASKKKIICFDELEIIDITDAMILSRLFKSLINNNIIFVITSNYSPENLYKHGLQRSQFIPFIELIKEKMNVIKLKNPKDLRKKYNRKKVKNFIYPINKKTEKEFKYRCDKVLKSAEIKKRIFSSLGRKLEFEKTTDKIIICDFAYICSNKFSPNDYIKIANLFDWFLIDKIPILCRNKLNEARRFIIFIDILYEKRSKLILRSEKNISNIFKLEKVDLPFTRTISRLSEMTSNKWCNQIKEK